MNRKVNALITDFRELAESLDLEPKEALEILNAQDWDADDDHVMMTSCSFPE